MIEAASASPVPLLVRPAGPLQNPRVYWLNALLSTCLVISQRARKPSTFNVTARSAEGKDFPRDFASGRRGVDEYLASRYERDA